MARVWRLADRTPVGEPLRGPIHGVTAVAAGALPDGTPVIVSGGHDRTVRAWRLADGTPLAHPLDLSESAGASPFTAISSSPRPGRTSPSTTWPLHGSYEIVLCPAATVGRHGHRIMAGYPVQRRRPPAIAREAARRQARDSGTLSGTSAEEERRRGRSCRYASGAQARSRPWPGPGRRLLVLAAVRQPEYPPRLCRQPRTLAARYR